MAPGIFINVSGNKEVYRPGEKVSGECFIDVTEPITAKAVRIYFYGRAFVEFEDIEVGVGHAGHAIIPKIKTKRMNSKENYFSYVITLWGRKVNEAGENSKLLPGNHKWSFTFKIPQRPLPSSFEGKYGSILYWLKIEIDKPFPWPNVVRYRCITILDNLNLNVARYKGPVRGSNSKIVSKVLGFGNAGKLQLSATTDRKGYAPGESIGISATMTNGSSKDMGVTKAKLIQRSHYYAAGSDKTNELTLAVVEGTKLLKGETKQWEWETLALGAIPPTSVSGSCHIIVLTYYIRMYIEVPFGFDLHLHLPVIIGTVPSGYKTGLGPRTGSNPSPLTVYAKCNIGCQDFSPHESGLPRIAYTPMTAFVPRYQFRAPVPGQTVTPTPKPSIAVSSGKTSSLPEVKSGCLVVRFSRDKLPEFQSSMKANQSSLEECDAEFVAVADKVEFSVGELWSADKALAVMVFPSMDKARSWVRSTPDISTPTWLGGVDIVLFVMREQHRRDFSRSFCSIQLSKCPRAPSRQELVEFGGVYTKPMRKARGEFGGRLLVSAASKGYENLRGKMACVPFVYSIHQWSSRGVFEKYSMYLQTGENKLAMDAWSGMYSLVTVVTVQDMGVAWLSDEPSGHASNATVDTLKKTEEIDDPTSGYLVMRFSATNQTEFRELVKRCKRYLDEKHGRLVALTSEIQHLEGVPCLENKSLAIFKFHQREDAKTWIKQLTEDEENVWLTRSDIFVMNCREMMHDEFGTFSLTSFTLKPMFSRKTSREELKKGGSAVKSSRLQHGGASLFLSSVSKKNCDRMYGDWPPDQMLLSCIQWPNSEVYQQFVTNTKSENEKMIKLVNVVDKCTFTTEDITWVNGEGQEKQDDEDQHKQDLEEYDINSAKDTVSDTLPLGAEGGDVNSTGGTTSEQKTEEIDDPTSGYLVMRFSASNQTEFRELVKRCKRSLDEKHGRLVALTSEIQHLEGVPCLENKTLAIFKFHQREDAKTWIKQLTEDEENVWLTGSDIFVMNCREMMHDEFGTFSLTSFTLKPMFSRKTSREELKKGGSAVKSSRLQHGGASLFLSSVSKKNCDRMYGDWPPDQMLLSCIQWPNSDIYQQFITNTKSENEKMIKLVNVVDKCTFITEDITWVNGDKEGQDKQDEDQHKQDLEEYDIHSATDTVSDTLLLGAESGDLNSTEGTTSDTVLGAECGDINSTKGTTSDTVLGAEGGEE